MEFDMMIKDGYMISDANKQEIESVIDEFDFETVKKVMDFLDWQWFDADDGVPRMGELRKKARYLLTEAASKVIISKEIVAESNIATGGFRASAYRYDDDVNEGKIYLKLVFELSGWDNYE